MTEDRNSDGSYGSHLDMICQVFDFVCFIVAGNWYGFCFCQVMANLPRYALIDDGSTFHVTWQCHNQDWLLKYDWAKQKYYDLLLRFKDRYKIEIYSWTFMSNHPHLTGRCQDKKLFSDFFRLVNSCFARTYNKRVGRKGQVVMDRFKSPRIETDVDLLKVMHYIDLNAKRAGIVAHPRDYKWSSYRYYAYGENAPLLTPASSYLDLGGTDEERIASYREMVEEILKNDWKEKRSYSSAPFIGNPDWVFEKTRELRRIIAEKKIKPRLDPPSLSSP